MVAEVIGNPALTDKLSGALGLVPSQRDPNEAPKLLTVTGIEEISGAPVHWSMTYREGQPSSEATLWVPGYFGIEEGYDAVREAGAKAGVTSITFDPPRNQEQLGIGDFLHPSRLLAKATWSVLRAAGYEGIEVVDLIGHSMGGPGAINTARHQVEKRNGRYPRLPKAQVRSVTLADSAGTTGHNALELGIRTLPVVRQVRKSWHDFQHGEQPPDRHRTPEQAVRHYAFANIGRTAMEGFACGQADLRDNIVWLQRNGILVAAIGHHNDLFFPGKRMQKHIGHLVGYFSLGNHTEGAGHFGPQVMPEAYIREHADALKSLGIH